MRKINNMAMFCQMAKQMARLLSEQSSSSSSSSSGSSDAFPTTITFTNVMLLNGQRVNASMTRTSETTTITSADGTISYPVYSGTYTTEENLDGDEWTTYENYSNYKLYACAFTDTANDSVKWWWMFGSSANSTGEGFDGFMGFGLGNSTVVPTLTTDISAWSVYIATGHESLSEGTITFSYAGAGSSSSSSSSSSEESSSSSSDNSSSSGSSSSPSVTSSILISFDYQEASTLHYSATFTPYTVDGVQQTKTVGGETYDVYSGTYTCTGTRMNTYTWQEEEVNETGTWYLYPVGAVDAEYYEDNPSEGSPTYYWGVCEDTNASTTVYTEFYMLGNQNAPAELQSTSDAYTESAGSISNFSLTISGSSSSSSSSSSEESSSSSSDNSSSSGSSSSSSSEESSSSSSSSSGSSSSSVASYTFTGSSTSDYDGTYTLILGTDGTDSAIYSNGTYFLYHTNDGPGGWIISNISYWDVPPTACHGYNSSGITGDYWTMSSEEILGTMTAN